MRARLLLLGLAAVLLLLGLAGPHLLRRQPAGLALEPEAGARADALATGAALLQGEDGAPGRLDAGAQDAGGAPSAAQPPRAGSAAKASASAPLHGVLRDRTTRQGIADFALCVRASDGARELVTTDAEGSFATAAHLPAGRVAVELCDTPDGHHGELELVHAPRAGDSAPVELAISIGPTLRLRLAGEALALAELGALLVPARASAALERARLAPLRADEQGVWVRFPASARAAAGDAPPWRLWVLARRGELAGSVDIDTLADEPQRVHAVWLARAGALRGRVREPSGAALAAVELELVQLDGGAPAVVLATSDAQGAFELLALAPGSYELRARSALHVEARALVLVALGPGADVELVLAPLALGGRIAGRLAGEGVLAPGTVVVAASVEPPERVFHATPSDPHDAPGALASFDFAALPPGSWAVRVVDPLHAWSPEELVVSPPAEGLVFTRAPALDELDLGLVVRDEAGAELERFSFRWRAGDVTRTRDAASGDVVLARHPAGVGVEWAVAAEGFATAYGDLARFDTPASGARPRRDCQLTLARGFGARFLVLGPNGAVAGATLVLDGVAAGTSDEHGRVEVWHPRAPERIEVLHPRLVLQGGDIDPRTGRLVGRALLEQRVLLGEDAP